MKVEANFVITNNQNFQNIVTNLYLTFNKKVTKISTIIVSTFEMQTYT